MRNNKRLKLEPLEARQMLAGSPQLIAVLNHDGPAHPRDFVRLSPGTDREAIYFVADGVHGDARGSSLYQLQLGSASSNVEIRNVPFPTRSTFPNDMAPVDLTVAGDSLFLTAHHDIGRELWQIPVSGDQPRLVKDINPGAIGSFPQELTAFNRDIYFSAYTRNSGRELWTSDGSEAGTVRLADLNPGPSSSFPDELVEAGGSLYFHAANADGKRELWKTNGLASGTVRVSQIQPENHANPTQLMSFNDELFFLARDEAGLELWKSDGTTAGTLRLADMATGPSDSDPHDFFEFNGELYFVAFDLYGVPRLWKTDGTLSGTTPVANQPIFSDGTIGFKDRIYFSGFDQDARLELFHSDGTPEGTELLRDIATGTASSTPENYFVFNDELFFSASTPDHGRELWKTDGTAIGTVLVKDLYPGTPGSSPEHFFEFDDELFFVANDGKHGRELWKTDGTEQGTRLVTDRVVGQGSSITDPHFTVLDGKTGPLLIFAIESNELSELWQIPADDVQALFPGDLNHDRKVSFTDFIRLAENFGKTSARREDGDLSGDGQVSFPDFLLMGSNFGRSYDDTLITVQTQNAILRFQLTASREVIQYERVETERHLGIIDFDGSVTSVYGRSAEMNRDGIVSSKGVEIGRLTDDGDVFFKGAHRGSIRDNRFEIFGFGEGEYTGNDVDSVAALLFFHLFFELES